MPIRVHCPNGCLLRMPAERSGKIIRCPGCKSTIAIPVISETEKLSGKPIPFQATLVVMSQVSGNRLTLENETNFGRPGSLDADQAEPAVDGRAVEGRAVEGRAVEDQVQLNVDRVYSDFIEDRRPEELQSIEKRIREQPFSNSDEKPSSSVEKPETFEKPKIEELEHRTNAQSFAESGLAPTNPVPSSSSSIVNEISPLQIQLAESEQKLQLQRIVDSFEAGPSVLTSSEINVRRPRYRRVKPPRVQSEIETFSKPGQRNEVSTTSWKTRLLNANRDRIVLARLLCFLIVVSALISVLPAALAWFTHYSNEPVSTPRWVFILGFLAAIKCLYAIFIFQVTDWSALKGTSIATLVIAFLYGLTATGLLIERGHGGLSDFLQLSHLIVQKATIWSVFMLCLETLIAYGSGKEAADWKRSEQLLLEIENGRS